MPNIITIIDPRGIKVVCSASQWNDHVLLNRPFMKDWLEDVKRTIASPDFIVADARHPSRQNYYLLRVRGNRYLKVIVAIKRNKTGELVTAYPTDGGKAGEKVIWTPSNNW